MSEIPNNETRMRILEVADELFSTRGYTGVRLRDIADAVGMKHASLYYYAPGGKQQLFIEVMERNFQRHHEGLSKALNVPGADLRGRLYGAAQWLVGQPPLDIARIAQADTNELLPEQASALMNLAFDLLRSPIREALVPVQQASQINLPDLDLAALAFLSLIQSVHNIPNEYGEKVKQDVARQLVDMLLDGWLKR